MKILHVNSFDIRGGAARAVCRIHAALQKNNIKSNMLVAKKNSNDENIKKINIFFLAEKKWLTKKLQSLSGNISYSSFNFFNSGIHREINSSDADIVNLHWLGNELINISEIKKIKKPIVWTLHDMWAFCGAEHYADINNSGQYRSGYREKKISLNTIVWERKKKHWQDIIFNFVSPSYWLAECLQESLLFKKKEVQVIRNCLDIKKFLPVDVSSARKKINIHTERKIVLFGADGKDSNPLKGFGLLVDSFKHMHKNKLQFVFFGGKDGRKSEIINGIDIINMGRIDNDDDLALLYSAADVFVVPSLIDNYPNTVLEAMSCGTPCVGFKVGGIPEMIDHEVNGYLVDPFDTKQLAEGLSWVLHDQERMRKLGDNARRKIEKECNETLIAEEYKKLYESILNNI